MKNGMQAISLWDCGVFKEIYKALISDINLASLLCLMFVIFLLTMLLRTNTNRWKASKNYHQLWKHLTGPRQTFFSLIFETFRFPSGIRTSDYCAKIQSRCFRETVCCMTKVHSLPHGWLGHNHNIIFFLWIIFSFLVLFCNSQIFQDSIFCL